MNILIWGAAGFIGTNLALKLVENKENYITMADSCLDYFNKNIFENYSNIRFVAIEFSEKTQFESILKNQDCVYHLVSSTIPSSANRHIPLELTANVVATSYFLEGCVKTNVKKVIFISSGGTVYGKNVNCPISEMDPTDPINSYGVQKLTIEKLFYLYYYMYGLDYRIVRLANPYGPYQKPNGILGAVTTFTYKALRNEDIIVFGNGSVIRDYIYIDDAVDAICSIASDKAEKNLYNVGSGTGTSILELVNLVKKSVTTSSKIIYSEGRKADVPVNYLDISRYKNEFGNPIKISLSKGIKLTANFLQKYYM